MKADIAAHRVAEPRPVQPLSYDRRSKGSWAWLVWLLVLGGLAVAGYFLWPKIMHRQQAAAPGGGKGGPRVIPVVVDTSKRGEMKMYINGLGTVTALKTVVIRSR